MRYILSSVGTSLLTNEAGPLTTLLRETANLREGELSPEQKAQIDARIAAVRADLLAADVSRRRRLSAELNGLHGLCGPRLKAEPPDLHYLLVTDTYQGRAAANLLGDVFEAGGLARPQEIVPPGLSTRSQQAFEGGIRHVIRWCEETFGHCQAHGIRVVFNLVGSFKSLQGYLNTIGMFYADEIIYIFEDPAASLLRIPRLPIRLDCSVLEENLVISALLGEGGVVATESLQGHWTEALWEETSPGSGQACLSTWGALVWERERRRLLSGDLLQFPRFIVSDSFRRDFDDRRQYRDERVDLHSALARVHVLLDEAGGDTSVLRRDGRLQYDNYTGANAGVGHFRVNNQGWRVSCTTESGGRLRLLRFGDHDTVNDNPR